MGTPLAARGAALVALTACLGSGGVGSPPAATLALDSQALAIEPYTYCWSTGGAGSCADGVPDDGEPELSVPRGAVARLSFDGAPPDAVTVAATEGRPYGARASSCRSPPATWRSHSTSSRATGTSPFTPTGPRATPRSSCRSRSRRANARGNRWPTSTCHRPAAVLPSSTSGTRSLNTRSRLYRQGCTTKTARPRCRRQCRQGKASHYVPYSPG